MNRKQYILETLERQNIIEVSAMDAIHLGLDVAGMVPGLGIVPDLVNAGLYTARGKKGMAALSLAAAVPIAGQAATAAKLGTKAVGALTKGAKAGVKTSKVAAKQAGKQSAAATKVLTKAEKVSSKATKAAKEGKKAFQTAKAAKGVPDSAMAIGKAYKTAKTAKGVAKQAGKATAKAAKKAETAATALTTAKTAKDLAKKTLKGKEASYARVGRMVKGRRSVGGLATRAAAIGQSEIGSQSIDRVAKGKSMIDATVSGITDAIKKASEYKIPGT
jgi:hypothetical protein